MATVKRRRSHKSGTLFKQGSTWSVQFFLPNGNRVKRVIKHPVTKQAVTTKAAAEQFAPDTIAAEIGKPENDISTLAGVDAEYRRAVEHTWTNKRRAEHAGYVRRWSKQFPLIENITQSSVGEYIAMRLQTVKPSSVNREINELKSVLSWAAAEPTMPISSSPLHGYKKLREQKTQRRVLTGYERFKFLRELYFNKSVRNQRRCLESAVKLWMMCLLWLYTGMRRSETLSIRLDHITFVDIPILDMNGKPCAVEGALIYLPKTKTGDDRTVSVSPMITSRLREYLEFHRVNFIEKRSVYLQPVEPDEPEHGRSPWLFPNNRDRSKHMVDPKTVFNSLREQCGLQGIVIHSFRHSFADRSLNDDGIPLTIGMSQLGHKRATTTMIYLRDDDRRKSGAFAGQGKSLRGGKPSRCGGL